MCSRCNIERQAIVASRHNVCVATIGSIDRAGGALSNMPTAAYTVDVYAPFMLMHRCRASMTGGHRTVASDTGQARVTVARVRHRELSPGGLDLALDVEAQNQACQRGQLTTRRFFVHHLSPSMASPGMSPGT